MARPKAGKTSAAKPSGSTCVVRIPRDYQGDYLDAQDQSTALCMTIDQRTADLVAEIAGGRHVGIVRRALCRNFITVSMLIEGVTQGLTRLEPVNVGALAQLNNSQIGLARILGTDVAAQQVSTVSEWVKAKTKQPPQPKATAPPETDDEPGSLNG